MWTAFPPSDYYAGSAPPGANSRRRACPPARVTRAGRATPDGSHVHHQTAQRRRRPAIPLRHRDAYPAALQRGLPTGDMNRPRSRPPPTAGVHRDPAHIRQVRAGGILRGVRTLVSHVHLSVSLAGLEPSGSTGPSRRCRGCLPPSPAPPGSGCPQLHQAAATARWRSPHISARSHGASWRSMSSCHSCRGRSTRKKPGRLLRSSGRRRWISFRSRITRSTRLRFTGMPSRRRTNAQTIR
jgi:hypothetical protein